MTPYPNSARLISLHKKASAPLVEEKNKRERIFTEIVVFTKSVFCCLAQWQILTQNSESEKRIRRCIHGSRKMDFLYMDTSWSLGSKLEEVINSFLDELASISRTY